jgi:hypothetical protein
MSKNWISQGGENVDIAPLRWDGVNSHDGDSTFPRKSGIYFLVHTVSNPEEQRQHSEN